MNKRVTHHDVDGGPLLLLASHGSVSAIAHGVDCGISKLVSYLVSTLTSYVRVRFLERA